MRWAERRYTLLRMELRDALTLRFTDDGVEFDPIDGEAMDLFADAFERNLRRPAWNRVALDDPEWIEKFNFGGPRETVRVLQYLVRSRYHSPYRQLEDYQRERAVDYLKVDLAWFVLEEMQR